MQQFHFINRMHEYDLFFWEFKVMQHFWWCGWMYAHAQSEVEKPSFDVFSKITQTLHACMHVLCINQIENNYDIYTNNGVTM